MNYITFDENTIGCFIICKRDIGAMTGLFLENMNNLISFIEFYDIIKNIKDMQIYLLKYKIER
jgi:hypothetical protein